MVVDAVKGSFLSALVGDKKGVIVPFQMVQSVGDIVIIKHVNPAAMDEGGAATGAPAEAEAAMPVAAAQERKGFGIFKR